MYHPGGTIKDAVSSIAARKYVLPAIQREFVWNQEQICALFDSLMQGYPFGEFLCWQIEPENAGKYRYYDFVLNYHQRDDPHCHDLGILEGTPLTAVLDGQQRLTAFNIGLRGSMAVKRPYKWWSSPDAFPRQVLVLDLLAQTEPDEEGNRYAFDFIEDNRVGIDGGRLWYKVSDILKIRDETAWPDMDDWLKDKDIDQDQRSLAIRILSRLYQAVHKDQTVCYYEEKNQDIEHVLNIFIRRNSGGTVLSYSDLLLSIATSQWENLDARKEVHQLVDDLNKIGTGLGLSKDFVLKAGLMLTDIASVGFQVRNFTHENMEILEKNWTKISDALTETVQLVTNFGFDSNSLRASSALLPIAYYIYHLGAPTDFDTHERYESDRRAIRGWLTRSILKPGVWGSGLDTLLTALREELRNSSNGHFPAAEMRRVMVQRGKSIEFSQEEIEDLADMGITDRRICPLLALLFPFIDLRNHQFHIDHVFPKSRFTPRRLSSAGVSNDQITDFTDRCNRIGNLQLLDGPSNLEKQAKLPADWVDEHFTDEQARQHYMDLYHLGNVPRKMPGFMTFYEARRERLQQLIAELVNTV
jgi:hypothetical protein